MSEIDHASAAKLLTPTAVAHLLGIRMQSLRVRRMRGQGPPYIRLGSGLNSRVAYPEEDFLQWLAARPRYLGTMQEKVALAGASEPARLSGKAHKGRGRAVCETTAPSCTPNAVRDHEEDRRRSRP